MACRKSSVHELSRTDARRIAVRAQLLDAPRPTDLIDVVRQLTLLDIEPTAAVAPSVDLVLWSRLGRTYAPYELEVLLENGILLELRSMIRPSEDIALYRAEMAALRNEHDLTGWRKSVSEWVKANDECRRDVLRELTTAGPLTAPELPDTCKVPWRSTGWTNNRNLTQLLEFMVLRGEVAVTGRRRGLRLWDLAERVYPDDPVPPVDDARRTRNELRLHSLGIARPRATQTGIEPSDVGEVGEPALVEGVKGEWRVDPAYLGQAFRGRAALLSPIDRLVYDRKRMADLFEFDYQLEMYKPVAKRRWGYYALPILYGDQLVGKLDATADRKAGAFRINALHQDVIFSKSMAAAVDREVADLAAWLGLELIGTNG
jgi:uncharacterized protein YcaQ